MSKNKENEIKIEIDSLIRGEVIKIPKDVVIRAKSSIQFDTYMLRRFGLICVAQVGYTKYYRVEESKGNFVWKHMMMNLHIGHEVEVETRYDLKIEINDYDGEFMILESSMEHHRCNDEYLLDVWNKIVEKVINE